MASKPAVAPVEESREDRLRGILTRRSSPDPKTVERLPKVWCRDCRDNKQKKHCSQHRLLDPCPKCGNKITEAHVDLDYQGHAEVTRALTEEDPLWSWEPMAFDEDGSPRIVPRGGDDRGPRMLVMWGWLTVHGKRLPCVGSCPPKDEADKELIGDLLRNGAMRFGIALDLWSKAERDAKDEDPPPPRQGAAGATKPPPATGKQASKPSAPPAAPGGPGRVLSEAWENAISGWMRKVVEKNRGVTKEAVQGGVDDWLIHRAAGRPLLSLTGDEAKLLVAWLKEWALQPPAGPNDTTTPDSAAELAPPDDYDIPF